MTKHRVYSMSFASVYPHYVAKAEKKGRTKAEVDEIVCWLTGYSQAGLEAQIENKTDFETFLADAPQPNPARNRNPKASVPVSRALWSPSPCDAG